MKTADPSWREIIRRHARPMQPIPTGRMPRLAELRGIRAVLCDLYGTLFISSSGDVGTVQEQACQRALKAALASMGITFDGDAHAAIEHLRAAIRDSHESSRRQGIAFPEVDIAGIWQTVLGRLATEGQMAADQAAATDFQRLAVEYEVRVNPVWPMPGLREFLREIRGRQLVMGLISNAQFFTPELFPALLGAPAEEWGFEPALQLFSYQYGRAKPGEELFRRALGVLEKRGLDAENALVLGNDVLNDLGPAHKLGFRTALFAGDRRSLRLREGDPNVAEVRPDLEVTGLMQLPPCLAG